MTDIVISIRSEVLAMILNLISVLLLSIALFLLPRINSKVSGNLKRTFRYFIIAFITTTLVIISTILGDLEVITPFIYNSFLVIPSLFFLLAIVSFYRSILGIAKPSHRRHRYRKEKEK